MKIKSLNPQSDYKIYIEKKSAYHYKIDCKFQPIPFLLTAIVTQGLGWVYFATEIQIPNTQNSS